MSAYHEAELAADFGGLTNLKVSHLSISVEGKVGLGRNRPISVYRLGEMPI
jgi:hypothetical protein